MVGHGSGNSHGVRKQRGRGEATACNALQWDVLALLPWPSLLPRDVIPADVMGWANVMQI